MDSKALDVWLANYKHCYENADADRLVTLFTPDATYQEHPFMERVHGRDFHRFWSDVVTGARERQIGFHVFCVSETEALVNWLADAIQVKTGKHREGDGVFHLTFAPDGRCSRLREWQTWHIVGEPLTPGWPNKG